MPEVALTHSVPYDSSARGRKVKFGTVAVVGEMLQGQMSHERSQHARPSAAHLAGSHIRQLKLVLVNAPSEAAVKLFHPTTEGALRERGTVWKAMHGALAKDGIWIYPKTSDLSVTI